MYIYNNSRSNNKTRLQSAVYHKRIRGARRGTLAVHRTPCQTVQVLVGIPKL